MEHKLFLPFVSTPKRDIYKMSVHMFDMIASRHDQERRSFVWSNELYRVALPKLMRMVELEDMGHYTDGRGPNKWATEGGVRLPGHYKANGNNIESSAAGHHGIDETIEAWYNSSGHRRHLLGTTNFYREQEIGCCVYFAGVEHVNKFIDYALFWSVSK